MTARSRRGVLIAVALALVALGCASGWNLTGPSDERHYRHPVLGYSIGVPSQIEGAPWREVQAQGAELAFANPAGATLSLQTQCQETEASDQLLARSLLIGLSQRRVVASGPWNFGPWHGWAQTALAGIDGGADAVRLRTFTLRREACVFDWVLVMPAHLSAWSPFDAAFDTWIESFRDGGFESADATGESSWAGKAPEEAAP